MLPSVVSFSLSVILLMILMKDSLSFIVLESSPYTVWRMVGVLFVRPRILMFISNLMFGSRY